jgi:hypothetical protein
MSPFVQGVWLSLPVILGGLSHVLAIKKNILPGLGRMRLDGGLQLRGRDLFGANKTVRGAMVMVLATMAWTAALDGVQTVAGLSEDLRYLPHAEVGSLWLGWVLGAAYILGELPNSFIKRQLDIGPGQPAPGGLRQVFWLLDQVDSVIAVLLALTLLRPPSLPVYAVVLGLTVTLHPAIAALMVALGLKQRVG